MFPISEGDGIATTSTDKERESWPNPRSIIKGLTQKEIG